MSPVEPAPACAWALEILLEGRDRLRDPDTARRLTAHLEGCADCRRVQTAERRLARALAAGPLPATPADLLLRVKALVRRRRLLRRLAVTGCAAALFGVAWGLVTVLRLI
jgi:predicted anti-sigma-YlaC factor YlaD